MSNDGPGTKNKEPGLPLVPCPSFDISGCLVEVLEEAPEAALVRATESLGQQLDNRARALCLCGGARSPSGDAPTRSSFLDLCALGDSANLA